MNLNQNIFLACACLFSTVIVGCSSSEGTSASFDVSIYPSKDLAKVYGYYPSFEVDILGAGNEDTIKLGTYSIDRYFESESPVRKYYAPVTFRFSDNDLKVKTLSSDDPAYKKIMGRSPQYLAVIVNLPYGPEKKEGEEGAAAPKLDPRIFTYQIPTGFFEEQPDLYLKIVGTGIVRTTKEDAEEELPEAPETAKQPQNMELNCVKSGGRELKCQELPPKEERAPN